MDTQDVEDLLREKIRAGLHLKKAIMLAFKILEIAVMSLENPEDQLCTLAYIEDNFKRTQASLDSHVTSRRSTWHKQ